LAPILALAQPAQAHCYRVWRYPTPQHCSVVVYARPAPKLARPAPLIKDIEVDPILIPPGWDEEQERHEALRQAQHELEVSQGGK
jgi:hypothetical protein